jgi:hypothetical protein
LIIPERGDIYYIEIAKSEIMGREFYGSHWYVVLSPKQLNAALNLFTAIPLTSLTNKSGGEEKDHGPFREFRTRILNADKKADPGQAAAVFEGHSIALPEQMRTFSLERLTAPRVGVVESRAVGAIENGILFMIGAGIHRQEPPNAQSPATQQAGPKKPFIPPEPPKPLPGRPVIPAKRIG